MKPLRRYGPYGLPVFDRRRLKKNVERDRELVELYRNADVTYVDLGARYGMSRQRVFQILAATGVQPEESGRLWHRRARHLGRAVSYVARRQVNNDHGTANRYNAGCSCDLCRAANTARNVGRRGGTPPTHGLSGYANYGCRCDICRAAQRAWNRNNVDKRRAYEAVGRAIKNGRLVRPACCDECGREGLVHGHHEDYAQPLDVDWLCSACHGLRHASPERIKTTREVAA